MAALQAAVLTNDAITNAHAMCRVGVIRSLPDGLGRRRDPVGLLPM
jgi:hypothetical protein